MSGGGAVPRAARVRFKPRAAAVFGAGYTKISKTKSYYYISFRSYLDRKQNKRNQKSYGKILIEKEMPVNDLNEIESLIFNKIWNESVFRKVVKEEVLNALKHGRIHNVSLLLFSYAFFDEISKESRFNKDDFLQIIKDDFFRNIFINERVEEELTTASKKFLFNNKDISSYRVERYLNYVLKHACLNHLTEKRVVLHINNDRVMDAKEQKAFNNMRTALAEKSLSIFSFRELTNWLIDRFKNGEIPYLCVLIELFTGIYPAEICALQWCDYKEIKYSNGRYHFEITKRMRDTGIALEPINVDKKQAYRLLPLPRIIDDLLKIHRNNLLNYKLEEIKKSIRNRLKNKKYNDLVEELFNALKINSLSYYEFNNIPDKKLHKIFDKRIFEETKNYPIICRSDKKYIKDGEEFMLPLSQREMRKYSKTAKEIGFDKVKNEFLMPKSKKKNDLNKVQLFRINFQHHAFEQCKLTLGEIAYILGNNAPNPFSGHYCDYTNDIIQKKMAEKLDLMVDAIYSSDTDSNITCNDIKSCKHNLTVEAGVGEVATDVITIIVDSDCDAKITIETDYGFDGTISSYII